MIDIIMICWCQKLYPTYRIIPMGKPNALYSYL